MTQYTHLSISIFLTCIISGVVAGIIPDVLDTGKTAVAAVAKPIEQTVVKVALRDCTLVKNAFKVRYADLKGDIDTSKLTLDYFQNDGVNVSRRFNLTEYSRNGFNNSDFDIDEPIYIFLHGFLSCSECEAAINIVTALKTVGKRNVFALDSSSLLSWFYLRSSSSVKIIGDTLGKVLVQMIKVGVKPENIHLIGHSLGAQMAGFAGSTVSKSMGVKIGRISGLDPAGPCFFEKQSELRLSKDDATFVDVIHSNAKVFGYIDRAGHVDFYPNGGEDQPGCIISVCSHGRSWDLYRQSILTPDKFVAYKCSNYNDYEDGRCEDNVTNNMGFGVDPRKLGKFYLNTSNKTPFFKREKQ